MASPKQIARRQAQRFFAKPGDVSTFLRQMKQEAGFQDLTSPAGAQGYAQFMPGTAAAVGLKNPHDPTQAYGAAAKLMRSYLDKYHGDWSQALTAYNAGPGAVGKPLPGETRAYLSSILGGSRPTAGAKPQNGSQSVSSAAGGTLSTIFDRAGFEQAQKRALLAGFLAHNGNPNSILFKSGLLSTAAPNPQDFASQALTMRPAPDSAPSSSSSPSSRSAPSSSGRYPLGKRGKVIGTPFSGTHAKAFNVAGGSDNWQSENAVDIAIPVGTPVYAVEDGVLGNTGSLGEGGRFAGLRTNLVGSRNSYYYAHLSKLAPGVHAGAHVRKGQLLGYSGAANGVAHLHFAAERGDPRKALR